MMSHDQISSHMHPLPLKSLTFPQIQELEHWLHQKREHAVGGIDDVMAGRHL